MKTIRNLLVFVIAFMANFIALGVDVAVKTGDISTGDTWTGSEVPMSAVARFNTSGGTYTAGADVTLGSVQISQNATCLP